MVKLKRIALHFILAAIGLLFWDALWIGVAAGWSAARRLLS